MSKPYRYVIAAAGYGAELVVGSVNPAFVKYWASRLQEGEDEDTLIEELLEFDHAHDEPEDAINDPEATVPPFPEYEGNWYDADDFEHTSAIFSDSWITVTPLDEQDQELTDQEQRFKVSEDLATIYGRECYYDEEYDSDVHDSEDDFSPVLSVMSVEKGLFMEGSLELSEPFDPKLLAVGLLETNMCELVDDIYYDGKPVDVDTVGDTVGKSMSARVGWLKREWHDTPEKMMGYLAESVQEWRDCLDD